MPYISYKEPYVIWDLKGAYGQAQNGETTCWVVGACSERKSVHCPPVWATRVRVPERFSWEGLVTSLVAYLLVLCGLLSTAEHCWPPPWRTGRKRAGRWWVPSEYCWLCISHKGTNWWLLNKGTHQNQEHPDQDTGVASTLQAPSWSGSPHLQWQPSHGLLTPEFQVSVFELYVNKVLYHVFCV